MRRAIFLLLFLPAGGCGKAPDGAGRASASGASAVTTSPVSAPASSIPPPSPLLGERVARTQWARSDDGKSDAPPHCAPLALASAGGAPATARAADFSGGWGVAFDLPGLRSAYGFAGPGVLPQDAAPRAAQRARLDRQWPYMRDLPGLPPSSFAGYGLSGAQAYSADNPQGHGLQSVAYVRVGGQQCTYNVWSRISRTHLETLLDNLRLLR